jgi:hypothetical protein
MKKQFDCVQMKWEIQQKIAEEFSGITDAKARQIQMKRIRRNPILGPFVKKVRLIPKTKAIQN